MTHELVPKATMIALLVNPEVGPVESNVRVVQEAARSLRLQVHVLRARTEQEIDAAFATLVRLPAGALMSYGPNLFEIYRQAGIYTSKILNGAKPAELPVLQPTKFELVINTRTAKALGLTIPQSLQVQAELI